MALKLGRLFLMIAAILSATAMIANPWAYASGRDQGGLSMLDNSDKLVVLWTSGDRDVALKMAFMYTLNAKKNQWWDDITLIVWGPSAKLLSSGPELQGEIRKMKEAGVVLEACIACADEYGVSDDLRKLGIDVKGMGTPLTDYIRQGRRVLTF